MIFKTCHVIIFISLNSNILHSDIEPVLIRKLLIELENIDTTIMNNLKNITCVFYYSNFFRCNYKIGTSNKLEY